MLAALVGVLSGATVLIIDSRKKHHENEVSQINEFIEERKETYETEFKNWQVSIVSDGQSHPLTISTTHDFDYLYSDIDEYTVSKYFTLEAAPVLRAATEKEVLSTTNGNLNVTVDL